MQAQHDVPRDDGAAIDELVALDDADGEAREVEVPGHIHAGHLGGLTADQGAARFAAGSGDAGDHLRRLVHIEPAGRIVIEEKERLGSLHDEIVDAHGDQIDAHRFEAASFDSEFELGPDAVRRRDEKGIAVFERRQVEYGAETAECAVRAEAARRTGKRLDGLHQPGPGVDIDARLLVGAGTYGILARVRLAITTPPEITNILYPLGFSMSFRKWSRGVVRLGVSALVVVLTLAAARAWAAADVFIVRDVAVDMEAETSAAARDEALAAAQRTAFLRLLHRLVPSREYSRLPDPAAARINDYVLGIEIQSERASAVRYIADVTVTFKADQIRRLLRGRGIPFAETRSKPILVLPIYETGGDILLWEQPNPWFEAWAGRPAGGGLTSVLAPLGDLSDISLVTLEHAQSGDTKAFQALADRYGAGSVLVATARLEGAFGAEPPVLQLNGVWYRPGSQELTVVDRVAAAPDQAEADLFKEGARRLAAFVEEAWKEQNLLRFDSADTLTAVVPLQRLEDWVEVQRRLASIAFVQSSALLSLSRSEAKVLLRYIGDTEQLAVALAQSDLSLERNGTSWILTRRSDSGTDG